MKTWAARISSWALKTFGQATPARALARFYEELDEFENETRIEKKVEEAADLVITLSIWAKAEGYDLTRVIYMKEFVNQRRAWFSRGDGDGNHVKNPELDAESRRIFEENWSRLVHDHGVES